MPARSTRTSRKRSSQNDLVCAAVLSGNRNFEARIHPNIKANFLASPPLVVAYAIAGRANIDLMTRAARQRPRRQAGLPARHLAHGAGSRRGDAVRHRSGDLPPPVQRFHQGQPAVEQHPDRRRRRSTPGTDSTYIAEPPFFKDFTMHPGTRARHPRRARARPSSATRSPPTTSARPARSSRPRRRAPTCSSTACAVPDFNSYGSRRGNHEVMMRGTFANVRIKNLMLPPNADGSRVEGGVTLLQPERRADVDLRGGDDLHRARHADHRLRRRGVRHRQLARLGGQGHAAARRQGRWWRAASSASTAPTWSAWACCPASSRARDSVASLRHRRRRDVRPHRRRGRDPTADGRDADHPSPATARRRRVPLLLRIDTPIEVDYYRHGGILPFVLRELLAA